MPTPPSVHLSPLTEADLRHVVSNSALSPKPDSKTAHRSPHRMGSLSPASMPSSPTSVHSSSSAIFERDIEPIAPSPPNPSHPPNPHRIPRGKATEQLEYSVPSVLDSAAAVLVSPDDSIAVVAPAHTSPEFTATSRSGLASPSSRLSSRSPSPTAARSLSMPSPSPNAT
ncbi:hypothetical protein K488DRAFT_83503 [Vararia minispora EC-137]|uniref:Uncharacterized protein n=1 Tax=Vararia minispora EC-137 TaxID=1314806 RepID=A0ACB8QU64_9AGAM|nr:hypothetical protein K488DRAFT_83503 [Vararia minispora EC-137]